MQEYDLVLGHLRNQNFSAFTILCLAVWRFHKAYAWFRQWGIFSLRRQQRLFEEIEGNWIKLQFNWSPQLNSSGPIIMLNKMRDAGSSIVYLKSEGWGGGCAQTQPWAPLSAFGQSVALVPPRQCDPSACLLHSWCWSLWWERRMGGNESGEWKGEKAICCLSFNLL